MYTVCAYVGTRATVLEKSKLRVHGILPAGSSFKPTAGQVGKSSLGVLGLMVLDSFVATFL